MPSLVHYHAVAEHVAYHAQPVHGVVVIDVAVYLVLVDTLRQQLADDEEDVRVAGVKRESARIRHHATIDGPREVLTQLVEEPHLPHHAEHQF